MGDSLLPKQGIDYEIEQADPAGKPIKRPDRKGSATGSFQKAAQYVETNKYDIAAKDDDSDDEEQKNPDLVGKTPNTRNRMKLEAQQEDIELLGPIATGFTIFKGFVCSGILYLPTNFITGGWFFSGAMLVFALLLTLFCIKLLLEVRNSLGGKMNFPEIGYAAYGTLGRACVEISLFASQFGFVCAYIYFIASQMTDVLQSIAGKTFPEHVKWYYAPLCFAILFPLVLVRKIQVFAKFHVFGDIMVAVTVITCMAYATADVSKEGWTPDYPGETGHGLPAFNSKLWPNCIGFAVYAFEGIGVILPIQDITADKDNYFKVVVVTCIIITLVYLIFAEYCLFAWYGRFTVEAPLITSYLPLNWFCDLIKVAFAVQLIISYTLVIYPANMIIESYVFKGWPKSRKRQMLKNVSRGILVSLTIVVALSVYNKLESFLAITGSLTCTPIAFTLPAWFHYKLCAKTT